MAIETTHNGHHIRYSENEDVWRSDGNELEAKTLSALKTKLNQWDAAKRRVDNVPVIVLGSHNWSETKTGLAVLLADGDDKEPAVWVNMDTRHHGQNGDRSKRKLSDIAMDRPFTHEMLGLIKELRAEEKRVADRIKEAYASIPRVTLEDLQGLKPLAEEPAPPPKVRERRR